MWRRHLDASFYRVFLNIQKIIPWKFQIHQMTRRRDFQKIIQCTNDSLFAPPIFFCSWSHTRWPVEYYTNAVVFQKVTQSNFFTRFKLLYNENNLDDLNKNFNEIRKLENMNQSRLWTKIGLANCSLIKIHFFTMRRILETIYE